MFSILKQQDDGGKKMFKILKQQHEGGIKQEMVNSNTNTEEAQKFPIS